MINNTYVPVARPKRLSRKRWIDPSNGGWVVIVCAFVLSGHRGLLRAAGRERSVDASIIREDANVVETARFANAPVAQDVDTAIRV